MQHTHTCNTLDQTSTPHTVQREYSVELQRFLQSLDLWMSWKNETTMYSCLGKLLKAITM